MLKMESGEMTIGEPQKAGEKGILFLKGSFDFRCIREFKNMYDPLLKDTKITLIELNMNAVEYVDNTALGMLLALREKAARLNKKVLLSEIHGKARQMLYMANFEKPLEILNNFSPD